MRTSTQRILTTHVGSLPRPGDVAELLEAKEFGEDYDAATFVTNIRASAADRFSPFVKSIADNVRVLP